MTSRSEFKQKKEIVEVVYDRYVEKSKKAKGRNNWMGWKGEMFCRRDREREPFKATDIRTTFPSRLKCA